MARSKPPKEKPVGAGGLDILDVHRLGVWFVYRMKRLDASQDQNGVRVGDTVGGVEMECLMALIHRGHLIPLIHSEQRLV